MIAARTQPPGIERLRRSGIRIDREGRFIHEGAEVRTRGCSARSSAGSIGCRPPDGPLRPAPRRAALRLPATSTTRRSSRARRASIAGRRAVRLALSDGAEEPLDPATLTVDGAGRAARLGARRPARGAARHARPRPRSAERITRDARSSGADAGGAARIRRCRRRRSGSVTVKRAPPSGDGSSPTRTSPPWSRTILRTIARPRPVPCSLVVT